jgi:hypothetical protein
MSADMDDNAIIENLDMFLEMEIFESDPNEWENERSKSQPSGGMSKNSKTEPSKEGAE